MSGALVQAGPGLAPGTSPDPVPATAWAIQASRVCFLFAGSIIYK